MITDSSASNIIQQKTDCDKYMVVERGFVIAMLNYIEKNKYSDEFLGRNIRDRFCLDSIKQRVGKTPLLY